LPVGRLAFSFDKGRALAKRLWLLLRYDEQGGILSLFSSMGFAHGYSYLSPSGLGGMTTAAGFVVGAARYFASRETGF